MGSNIGIPRKKYISFDFDRVFTLGYYTWILDALKKVLESRERK